MSKENPTNLAASVRQRLLNLARRRKDEFQLVLIHYGLERLLYRLSISEYANQFTLKGALLFQLWVGQPHRSTLDLDLLGKGNSDVERFKGIFRQICTLSVPDDGLLFLPESVTAEEIREDQRYNGIRIHATATLGKAKIPIQVDIGFGDAVTPASKRIDYPSLLGFPAPKLRAYPKETVVAEKFEAMVSLGITNSRMKDFYDLWMIARDFEFDGEILSKAIQATFRRRGTNIPTELPVALAGEFAADRTKQTQWRAFIGKGKLLVAAPSLEAAIRLLRDFLWTIVAPESPKPFNKRWDQRTWS
jgi:nucleotidyltransferase AbiEii toxin of type IV toxin-antitoxin system